MKKLSLTEATMLALEGKLLEDKNEEEIQNFINQCEEDNKFDNYQMEEIRKGFENRLTLEQIKTYADPKFDDNQMQEIRIGFEDRLTLEQVKFYADPKFRKSQMQEIRIGFEDRLTLEQVKIYADPKFRKSQMEEIREGFENKLSLEQVKFYADPKFDNYQMQEIRKGFENRLTLEQVKTYADPKIEWYEMQEIRQQLEYKSGLLKKFSNDEEDDEEDEELVTYIDINDNEEEAPYLYGYANIDVVDYDIENRNDLNENELFITGWSGIVQNLKDAPFKSFKDMEISCFDNEKGGEYNLPDIPKNIQEEFIKKVNKWVEENPDMLEESKKLTKDKSNKLKKIAKEQIDFDLNKAGYYYWELINNGIDRDEFIRAMMNEDEGGMMNQYNLSYEDACKVYGLIWDNMPGMLDESEKYKKLKESKKLPIAKVFATERELDQYIKDNHIQTSECHTFKNGIVLIYEPDRSENKKLKEDDWDYLEENKKLIEDYDNEIKVYMNTWKNYNEYGADLVLYDNIDGWMSIEEAKEFAELHNDDEPFINDTENCPIKVSEYDNCMKILEDLEAYEDCDDKEVLTAILESENDDIQNALEILNSGDYIFFADIDNDEDLAHAYIDMIGGLDGINNIEDYIDENAYKESWREIAENTIREEQPDLDENSDEFENEVELWLDTVYPEQLALAIENNSKDLEDYFDYEAYGRDLSFKYFYASTGAISII